MTSTKRSRAGTTANSIVIGLNYFSKKLRTESHPEPTVQLPEVESGPEPESELEVEEEAELEEGSNTEFQSHEPTEEIYMRQDFPGKAPTPGIPSSHTSNSPPLLPCHSELFDTKNFSLYQFATGGYPDPLDPSKPWSLPETLPGNLEPTSKSLAKDVNLLQEIIQQQGAIACYQKDVEFAIYLNSKELKLVKQDAIVVDANKVVLSKAEDNQRKQDLIGLIKEVRRLQAENAALKEEREAVMKREKIDKKEKDKKKEELTGLMDTLSNMIKGL
ncbi:hypothetical protein HOY80DRAFT_1141884 [Tuber brumale]|nr:hypothetical protein HOY80DRAFT_1141884 [Tuber brumale]